MNGRYAGCEEYVWRRERILLHRAGQHRLKPAEPTDSQTTQALCDRRVLCVAGHATSRQSLKMQLQTWGMEVDCVGDGPTTLTYLQEAQREERPYALALLDCCLVRLLVPSASSTQPLFCP
jgi:hypothetical protein